MTLNSTKPTSGSPAKTRVVVAMSGGVDSSVAAAMLAREGHDVIGVTLQLYDHGSATGRKGSCCAGQDIHDARRVAETLGFPHYVLDYEKRFKDQVINAFADSYVAGETPVPCVTCNSQIKFTDLLETAKDLGATALATGHYIQRIDGPDGPQLRRAVDASRDQSYFLYATTRAQLKQLWFPLGGMPKSEVRKLAHEFGLMNADKADSQDICFVPSGKYSDVIERLKPGARHPGRIVHIDGRELGSHDGIINYTVGQRRGLKIPAAAPLYVIRINAENHEVVVGPREALLTKTLDLRAFNWLADDALPITGATGLPLYARVRSTAAPKPATLFVDAEGNARVTLAAGEDGVSAGQACVLYDDDTNQARILGGGTIARAVQDNPFIIGAPAAAKIDKSPAARTAPHSTRAR